MSTNAVHIRVETADALTHRCRVLVLKHAGYSYGVDHAAVRRLEINPLVLPAPGDRLVVPGGAAVPADAILFLGTTTIDNFDYRTVREFGRRALSEAAAVMPDATEVCLTLHGVGFGLDEREAFLAEVAGLVDAISTGEAGSSLRTVTFLERNERAADRMRALLALTLLDGMVPWARPLGQRGTDEAGRLHGVGYDSESRQHAVVAMPFAESFDDRFHYGIERAVRTAGFLCERVDKMAYTGDVVDHLKKRIRTATLLVADLTDANANVYLEVGFAWGCEVPTVLVCGSGQELKFDVRGQRCLVYESIRDLEQKLTRELTGMFAGS